MPKDRKKISLNSMRQVAGILAISGNALIKIAASVITYCAYVASRDFANDLSEIGLEFILLAKRIPSL